MAESAFCLFADGDWGWEMSMKIAIFADFFAFRCEADWNWSKYLRNIYQKFSIDVVIYQNIFSSTNHRRNLKTLHSLSLSTSSMESIIIFWNVFFSHFIFKLCLSDANLFFRIDPLLKRKIFLRFSDARRFSCFVVKNQNSHLLEFISWPLWTPPSLPSADQNWRWLIFKGAYFDIVGAASWLSTSALCNALKPNWL